jgi:hypothetical protein
MVRGLLREGRLPPIDILRSAMRANRLSREQVLRIGVLFDIYEDAVQVIKEGLATQAGDTNQGSGAAPPEEDRDVRALHDDASEETPDHSEDEDRTSGVEPVRRVLQRHGQTVPGEIRHRSAPTTRSPASGSPSDTEPAPGRRQAPRGTAPPSDERSDVTRVSRKHLYGLGWLEYLDQAEEIDNKKVYDFRPGRPNRAALTEHLEDTHRHNLYELLRHGLKLWPGAPHPHLIRVRDYKDSQRRPAQGRRANTRVPRDPQSPTGQARPVTLHTDAQRRFIAALCRDGVIAPAEEHEMVLISAGFFIVERGDKFRFIWDGRALNESLPTPPRIYHPRVLPWVIQAVDNGETQAMTCDVKAAFYHIRLHKGSRRLCAFAVRDHDELQVYKYVRLPMGLSWSPFALGTLARGVEAAIEARFPSTRCAIYADDMAISYQGDLSPLHAYMLQREVEAFTQDHLGIRLSAEKTTPFGDDLDWLGYRIHLRATGAAFAIQQNKYTHLRTELRHLAENAERLHYLDVARVLGLWLFAEARRGAFAAHLPLFSIVGHGAVAHGWDTPIPENTRTSIAEWAEGQLHGGYAGAEPQSIIIRRSARLRLRAALPAARRELRMHQPASPAHIISDRFLRFATDATPHAVAVTDLHGCPLITERIDAPVLVNECLAVVLALALAEAYWRHTGEAPQRWKRWDSGVIIFCDNQAVVHAAKRGSTRSPALALLAGKVEQLERAGFMVEVEYIKTDNNPADYASRTAPRRRTLSGRHGRLWTAALHNLFDERSAWEPPDLADLAPEPDDDFDAGRG